MSGAEGEPAVGRRNFLGVTAAIAAAGALAAQGFYCMRALVPDVLYERPRKAKIGPPDRFADGITYLDDENIFVIKEGNAFQAMSAACTHLGCTVKFVRLNRPKTIERDGKKIEVREEFHCPCHGSRYYGDGTNYAAPAPRPLDRFRMLRSPDDGQLVVDLDRKVGMDERLTV